MWWDLSILWVIYYYFQGKIIYMNTYSCFLVLRFSNPAKMVENLHSYTEIEYISTQRLVYCQAIHLHTWTMFEWADIILLNADLNHCTSSIFLWTVVYCYQWSTHFYIPMSTGAAQKDWVFPNQMPDPAGSRDIWWDQQGNTVLQGDKSYWSALQGKWWINANKIQGTSLLLLVEREWSKSAALKNW